MEGTLDLPDSAVTLRKLLPNLIITLVDQDAVRGESQILKLSPGDLTRLAIVSAGDTIPGSFVKGGELTGERYQTIDGKKIRIRSTGNDTVTNPPRALSTGLSIAMAVNGYDQFDNLFADPIACRWSAFDTADAVANFPPVPVMPRYLAIRSGSSTMNLLFPNEESMGHVRVDRTETDRLGVTRELSAESGVMQFLANKPTVLIADIFSANPTTPDSPTPPGALATPVTSITAGAPIWIRFAATNSLGQVATTWQGEYKINFKFLGSTPSPGWPHALDLATGMSAQFKTPANLSGNDVNNTATGGALVPREFELPVKFESGYGWLRMTTGTNLSMPLADRNLAVGRFYTVTDKVAIQAQDLVNNLVGQTSLPPVTPAPLKNMRMTFNDEYVVPASLLSAYPQGIRQGISLNDFELNVGFGISVASKGYDEYGNDIGLVSANWSAAAGFPEHFLGFTTNSKTNFIIPSDILPAGGRVVAKAVGLPTVSSLSGVIKVFPGLPKKFNIEPLATVKAGEAVGYKISAVDQSNNVVTTYDTAAPGASGEDVKISVKISITGLNKVPEISWFANTAAYDTYVTRQAALKAGVSQQLEFVNGVATVLAADSSALYPFSVADAAIISVQTSDLKISGQSAALTVSPNAIATVRPYFAKSFSVVDGNVTRS